MELALKKPGYRFPPDWTPLPQIPAVEVEKHPKVMHEVDGSATGYGLLAGARLLGAPPPRVKEAPWWGGHLPRRAHARRDLPYRPSRPV